MPAAAPPPPAPDLHQAVNTPETAPSAPVAAEPQAPEAAAKPAPEPPPPPPPADDDTPGAFMDVLSRADAEAQAASEKRKPS